jgi:Ca2+-binding EF-hand superfamily protein
MTSTGTSWRVRGSAEEDYEPGLDLPTVSIHDDAGPVDSALRSSRAQQIASQIDNLKVERALKEEEMKKMSKTASDSFLLERSAKKRAEANREVIDHHKKRAAKLDQQINALQDGMAGEDNKFSGQHQGISAGGSLDSSHFPQSASGASNGRGRSAHTSTGDADFIYDYEDDEAFFYPDEMNWTPQQVADLQREIIREQLIEAGGTAKKAFRKLDLNGSGKISCMDFADGVARCGVPWQDLTGLKRPEQIFRLFDQDKDGVIVWSELFPAQANEEDTLQRPSTPDFLETWFRKTKTIDFSQRASKWSPATPEEELKVLFDSQSRYKDAADKRRWMAASFRRLKNKGKTDARARECIAAHLPRGSGPRDRDACATFSDAEVRSCRKSYQDSLVEPVKNIQKEVYEMKEQRRTLQNFRMNLEKISKKGKQESVQKEAASALLSFGLGKNHVDEEEDDS